MWKPKEYLYRKVNYYAYLYPELYSEDNDYLLKEEFIREGMLGVLYAGVPKAAEQIFSNKEAVGFLKTNYPEILDVLSDLVSVMKGEVDKTDNLEKYPSYYDAICDVQIKYLEYVEWVSLRFERHSPLVSEDRVFEIDNTGGLLSDAIKDYESGFVACLNAIRRGKLDLQELKLDER